MEGAKHTAHDVSVKAQELEKSAEHKLAEAKDTVVAAAKSATETVQGRIDDPNRISTKFPLYRKNKHCC